MKKNPGLELVAFSRVKSPQDIAVRNKSGALTRIQIQKIGQGNVYELRREFQERLKSMARDTQAPTIQAITDLDPNDTGGKTYEGGCQFLLNWFNDQTSMRQL